MEYSDEEIKRLKNDPVFINELQQREERAERERDIVQLYDVLDTILALDENNKERINKIYGTILEVALEQLQSKLEGESFFDLDNERDHLALRAIYEYGIEQYNHDRLHEAKELFIMLSILTNNPTFIGAMQIHLIAILKNIPFNEFLEKFVDMEKMNSSNESFFILYFYDSANRFLHENGQLIREAIQEVKNLKI